ncbi:TetR/AcrR family transcriptional regulator [Paenibacillus apii]|uniref:TetR/AcrR family transcriptional regulator n=1 Tax=Paenibacillus apii TaxID=1850370 RepID=UPI00143BF3DF|nr:TetR/AcrR family transcriptional regulator [Paenibacillus apii]NJJ38095.1 TetR/AcrR family transcriptional regulator [Paenibacillus apii]
MPKPKTDSKERLIEAASRLFSQQGYQATGLSQIVEESGAPRGSVYFLFPEGKESIAVEAIKQSAAKMRELLAATSEQSVTMSEWISQISARIAQRLQASDFRSGSPFAAVALDAASSDSAALGEVCHKAYDEWIQDTTAILTLKFSVDPGTANVLAVSAIGAIEGALILCRAQKSTEPLSIVTQMLIEWVENK